MSIAAADRMASRSALWVPGDWNGFFGLFTNVLLNVIVLTGLCLGVVQMPAASRLRPHPAGARHRAAARQPLLRLSRLAAGQAREPRRRRRRCRTGRSVPHMFIVVFLIMLPVYLKTKDPVLAWQAGLVWCLRHRAHRAAGRLCRPDDPSLHPARGDARARWPGSRSPSSRCGRRFSSWEEPWLVPAVVRDRAGQLDRRGAAAVRRAGRARRGRARHGPRLAGATVAPGHA